MFVVIVCAIIGFMLAGPVGAIIGAIAGLGVMSKK